LAFSHTPAGICHSGIRASDGRLFSSITLCPLAISESTTFKLVLIFSGVDIGLAYIIQDHPGKAFAVIIEPNAIAGAVMATEPGGCPKGKVDNAEVVHSLLVYVLQALNQPNAFLYMSAAHGGVLGEDYFREKAADIIASIVDGAGCPSQFRGFATNVANYNSW
jgi:hypothetical protein